MLAFLRVAVPWLVLLFGPATFAAETAGSDLASRVATVASGLLAEDITPANVAAKLRPLLIVKKDVPSEAEWTFSGAAPEAGVSWARVTFQAAAEREKWEFVQLELALFASQAKRASLGRTSAAELTRKLGPPSMPASGAAEHVRLWKTGGARVVSLREAEVTNPLDGRRESVVLVEIAVPQGEREDE